MPVMAQRKNTTYQYHIKKATAQLKIDGEIDQAWANCQTATDFHMVLPMDTSKAKVRTEVKMAYDQQNLYIITINYIEKGQQYMVESLKRDFNFGKNDNFQIGRAHV